MVGQYRSDSYSGDKKRPSSDAEDAPAPIKRVKKEDEEDEDKKFIANNPYLAHTKEESDTKAAIANNPYLAHMKEEEDTKNGFRGYGTGLPEGSALHNFTRRETTAKQAEKAEDGSESPFTGEPHSQQYFKILKTRRTLPIHKQR
jgi:pre-mRNA-splicing factor ATP-dependent RNA helicase DHX15/PRP43